MIDQVIVSGLHSDYGIIRLSTQGISFIIAPPAAETSYPLGLARQRCCCLLSLRRYSPYCRINIGGSSLNCVQPDGKRKTLVSQSSFILYFRSDRVSAAAKLIPNIIVFVVVLFCSLHLLYEQVWLWPPSPLSNQSNITTFRYRCTSSRWYAKALRCATHVHWCECFPAYQLCVPLFIALLFTFWTFVKIEKAWLASALSILNLDRVRKWVSTGAKKPLSLQYPKKKTPAPLQLHCSIWIIGRRPPISMTEAFFLPHLRD